MNTVSCWFHSLIHNGRSLRRLDKADLDLVLNYIDTLNPSLRDHVAGLTFLLLPCLIEFGCLPAQKLAKSHAMDQPDPALTLGVAGYHASMVEQPAYQPLELLARSSNDNINSHLLDGQDSASNL